MSRAIFFITICVLLFWAAPLTAQSMGVIAGTAISQPAPVYPAIAKAKHVSGDVVLKATITKQGDVTDVTAISGPSILRGAAITAAKQWKYRPYLLNGEPTEVETTININFELDNKTPATASPAPPVPAPSSCAHEGPPLAETLSYINKVIAGSQTESYYEGGRLIWKILPVLLSEGGTSIDLRWNRTDVRYDPVASSETTFIHVMPAHTADCVVTRGTDTILLHCLESKECISVSDSGYDKSNYYSSEIEFKIILDDEHSTNLQRAFSHLIALLKKQYSETHIDTDPFSK